MMLHSTAHLLLSGTTCAHGSLPCVAVSSRTAALVTSSPTNVMWLRLGTGWPLPTAPSPFSPAMLTCSLLMPASPTCTPALTMAASPQLLPPSAKALLASLMMTPLTLLPISLT